MLFIGVKVLPHLSLACCYCLIQVRVWIYIITVNSKDVKGQGNDTYGLKLFIPRTGRFGMPKPILVSSPTCTQQGIAE